MSMNETVIRVEKKLRPWTRKIKRRKALDEGTWGLGLKQYKVVSLSYKYMRETWYSRHSVKK